MHARTHTHTHTHMVHRRNVWGVEEEEQTFKSRVVLFVGVNS